jgi:lysozyme family protein
MANLYACLPFVLSHEVRGWPTTDNGALVEDLGAAMDYVKLHGLKAWFSDDPLDHGGATAFGMTLRTATPHGISTVDDLQAISAEKLASIYRAEFWRFDGLDEDRVAMKLLDLAVNTSLRTAVRMVQAQLNALGAGLAEDGIWGPTTEGSVNAVEPNHLLALLVEAAVGHYRAIVQRDRSQGRFLAGWLNRAAMVPA